MTLSDALSTININPVFLGITLLIAVIAGATALYNHFNVTIDEHIEKLRELDSEYSSNESTLSSLEEELKTASSRMRELSEIDSPTLIEQGEMAKLKETCSDLEREIELLKQRNAEIEKQRSDNASAAWDQMNQVSYSSPWRADYEVTMYDPYMGSYQERMSAVQYAGYAMEQIRDIESQIQELELDGLTPDEQKEKVRLDNLVQNYKTALEEIRDDAVAVGTDASNALADKIMTFFNVDYGYKKIAETVPDILSEGIVSGQIKELSDGFRDANDEYASLIREVNSSGIDLSKVVYGNIDLDDRQILEWTDSNLTAYKDAIESWGSTIEELRGSFSTVFGSSDNFDGVEIAFSPMLQTANGAVLLDQNTVYEYIWSLIEKAGENWSSEDLLRLDTEGLELDGRIIKNLIADIGDTAIATGEAMHYAGNTGAVQSVADDITVLNNDIESFIATLRNDSGFQAWVNSAIELGVITDDSTESVWGLIKAAVAAGQQNGIESLSEDAKTLSAHLKSLSGVQSNFESLSKALKEFSDDGIISADTLEDLAKAFVGDTEAFQNFVNVAGDSSSTFSEVQAACNRLAESWVNSSDFLSNLTEETAEMTIAQLKNIGVTNAEEVVVSALTASLWNSADASDAAAQSELRLAAETAAATAKELGLENAEWNATEAKLASTGATTKAITALRLYRQETYNSALKNYDFANSTSAGIEGLLGMAKSAGIAAEKIGYLTKALALQKSIETHPLGQGQDQVVMGAINDLINKAKADVSDATASITLPNISISLPKSSSSSSSSKEIENYTVDIENFREALEDLADTEEKIATSEVKLDLIPDDDIEGKTKAILGIIDLYGLAQANLHDLNTERDNYLLETQKKLEAQGFSVEYDPVTNDFFVKNPEHINDLKAYKNGVFDQEATNEMRKAYAELIKNANEYNQANIDGSLKWWEYEKKKRSYLEDIHQYRMDAIEDEKDAIESLLDLTIDMIKQEKKDEIDALEEQRDIYADIIDQRREMLQLLDRERTYQQDLADKTSELSKLQARADTLQLAADSGDRNAALELGSVREEIAEKQREINDLQHDHYVETTEDALDTELDNFENQQDAKIKEIQDFLNDNEKLQQAALTRLDTMNSELFADLRIYAVKYTSTTGTDLQNMWDNAFKAAERYGNFTNAMSTLSTESGVNKEAQASSIVAQMKYNGQQWHTASAAQQQKLQDDNVKLAADLSQLLGTPVTIKNGVWWINGKKLFEVYHTGTASVGGIPTLQQNEMWAKLQKGEMVLNQSQQDGLWNILSNMNPAKMLDKLLSPLASLNNLNFAPADGPNITIDASINIDGTLPDEQILSVIKKQPRVIGNAIAEQLGISGWKWRG